MAFLILERLSEMACSGMLIFIIFSKYTEKKNVFSKPNISSTNVYGTVFAYR